MKAEHAFTARSVSTFSLDRLYRVYSSSHTLVFIRIGGQEVARAVAHHFGLIGTLIFAWWQKRSQKKLQDRLAAEQQQDLESLLARDASNFLLNAGQIVRATIEPPAFFGTHGTHYGVWKLEETSGKKYTLQFEELSEMREAMAVLPAVLGPSLTVLAEWNEKKKAYTKRSASQEREFTTVSR